MRARAKETIPAFLSIDVEPDAFQISPDDADVWPGYAATYDFAQSLRAALAKVTPTAPRFGWYYRTDPQIEEVCGRADAAMSGFPGRLDALRAAGDYFGVHAHPLRWSDEHRCWVHDVGDPEWLRECTQRSLEGFEAFTGERARRYRFGAGFLSDEIVDVLDRHGVDAECSLEPVESWGLRWKVVPTAIDESPMVGRYRNCVDAPKTPYHPSAEDFRRGGGADARRLLLVPMTTAEEIDEPEGWRDRVRRLFHPEPPRMQMLYPSEEWPSERHFWDRVERRLRSMERPYLSLGVRTDRENSLRSSRVVRLFTALADHPLAKRLRFVDPLEVGETLVTAPDTLHERSIAEQLAVPLH